MSHSWISGYGLLKVTYQYVVSHPWPDFYPLLIFVCQHANSGLQIRQKYDSQEDVLNCWPYHQCIINQSRMSRSGLDKISNGTNDMMGRNFFAWDHSRYQSKHTYISLHRYAVN